MGELIYGQQDRLIDWARQIIDFNPRPDVKAVGFGDGNRLRVVTLYDGFSACDCNIHIASDRSGHAFTLGFLRASFAHPFLQWNLRRVTGLVPSKNTAALRFDYHLGFKYEGLCRDALPDDDVIVLGMLRSECRFIPRNRR